MNKIRLLNIEYLRRNRGIETYELSLKEEREICYVYNFEDINGYAYNIILPFVRIQVGTLFKNN